MNSRIFSTAEFLDDNFCYEFSISHKQYNTAFRIYMSTANRIYI
jgi:hypothetical protein